MIKIILEHYISKANVNGNRRSKCKLTKVNDRKWIKFHTTHNSNAYHMIKDLGFKAEEVFEVMHTEIPIREWEKIAVLPYGGHDSAVIACYVKEHVQDLLD